MTSPVPVKLQFTFVIPDRTAKGGYSHCASLEETVSGNDTFCAEWVKRKIAAHIMSAGHFQLPKLHVKNHRWLYETIKTTDILNMC